MSNVLILSENETFKSDLSDQIKHHIPDFEVTEDKDSADIIVVDENADILKSIEKNIPVIFLSFDDNSSVKAHTIIQKPFVLSAFLDTVKSSINIFENSDEGNLEFNDYKILVKIVVISLSILFSVVIFDKLSDIFLRIYKIYFLFYRIDN